ncbi:MAG TPA: YegS/Rv2252/BmrU family lipid kinase [Bacteroidia bacterium]|nr:YegS/Rv2252/BmrU family lipid kinase [Bacteroidia bacterium]
MSMPQTYLFIINPKAGARSKENVKDLILQKAAEKNKIVEVVFTTHAGHAYDIALQADENKYKVIAAVGGDGTINEIGRGLIHKSIALAIVPMGSGNGLARFNKIPLKVKIAIEVALTGKATAMDVIKLNDFLSFNVSGIGFDSAVAHEFQHLQKRGFWGYFKLVLKQAFHFKPIEVNIDLFNGEHQKKLKDKLFLLAIANSNQFGNNAIIAPAADTSDGKFNLVLVKPFSFLFMPYYATMMFLNKFDKIGNVLSFESNFCIVNSENLAWHIDGEPVHLASPIEIKILPLAIQIIIPQ